MEVEGASPVYYRPEIMPQLQIWEGEVSPLGQIVKLGQPLSEGTSSGSVGFSVLPHLGSGHA